MGKFAIGARVRDPENDLATITDKRKGERFIKYDNDRFPTMWWDKNDLTVFDQSEVPALQSAAPRVLHVGQSVKFNVEVPRYGAKPSDDILVVKAPSGLHDFIVSYPSGIEQVVIGSELDLVVPERAAFKLELGKTYVDRDGRQHGPLTETTASTFKAQYPFTDGDNTWSLTGAYYVHNSSSYDLVAEAPTPKPIAAPGPVAAFKTGDRVAFLGDGGKLATGSKGVVFSPHGFLFDVIFDGFDQGHGGTLGWNAAKDHWFCLANELTIDEPQPVTEPEPFKIEIGKTYLDRKGERHGPIVQRAGRDLTDTYPFAEDEYEFSVRCTYQTNGSVYGARVVDDGDLIAEAPELPVQASAPVSVEPRGFVVGDKVECIEAQYELKLGDYLIEDIYTGSGYIKVKGVDGYWMPERFKLIEPAPNTVVGNVVTLTGKISGVNHNGALSVTFDSDGERLSYDFPAAFAAAA